MDLEQFEDSQRTTKQDGAQRQARTSPYCDVVYYRSSKNPELQLAMRVLKPARPGYILAKTHGWHMSMPAFEPMESPGVEDYLVLEVDMRGRAYSDGQPDCNGWELLDVIDAVQYAREHYEGWIKDPEVVYFEGGSGGGGNALALAGKFPDFFAAITALCGVSDYASWYREDRVGEFRDDMDIWIGCPPDRRPAAYEARSGLFLAPNVRTPVLLVHGETDERISVEHSRLYEARMRRLAVERSRSGQPAGPEIRYWELPGVGTRSHWGHAAAWQLEEMARLSEQNRASNRRPVELPRQGELMVGGYVYTKHFALALDHQDKTAVLQYDLDRLQASLTSEEPCNYTITWY